ncbi:terpene synthase family protein [Streptomyces sp. NPDC002092]
MSDTLAPVISFFLPDIRCAFPVEVNPHYEAVESEVADWTARVFSGYDQVDDFWIGHARRSRHSLWQSMVFPDVDRGDLLLWSKITSALTVFHDAVERDRETHGPGWSAHWRPAWHELLEGAEHISRTAASGHDPVLAVDASAHPAPIKEILRPFAELRRRMTPRVGNDFMNGLHALADGIITEFQVGAEPGAGAALDLDTYLEIRRRTYGLFYIAALPALNRTGQLTPDELDSPQLAQLKRLAHTHTCLVNDAYSFRMEYIRNADRVTDLVQAIPMLAHRHASGWQDAVDRLVDMIHRIEQDYLRLRTAWITDGASPAARETCRRLEWIMSGNLQYMKVTPRYHGTDFQGEFTGGLVICDPAEAGRI